MTDLQQAFSPDIFRQNAHTLVDLLADYLESAQNQTLESVIPYQEPDRNNSSFSKSPKLVKLTAEASLWVSDDHEEHLV